MEESLRLIREELGSLAMRTARSKPSSTRSTIRSDSVTSSTTLGWRAMNSAHNGARCKRPNETGTLTLSWPLAWPLRDVISDSASSMLASSSLQRA